MNIEFDYELMPQKLLEVSDLGNFAVEASNEDGYYYYGSKDNLTKLMPDDTSSSFINSVTFNENIKANLKETVSEDGQTITYQSDGNGYDNAQYTLTLKLETVQYDQAENIW